MRARTGLAQERLPPEVSPPLPIDGKTGECCDVIGCNNNLEECLHITGCPAADYLNAPPAAHLGLYYPKPDRLAKHAKELRRIAYLGFDPRFQARSRTFPFLPGSYHPPPVSTWQPSPHPSSSDVAAGHAQSNRTDILFVRPAAHCLIGSADTSARPGVGRPLTTLASD